jgi:Domain of unknown function (DUF4412)
VESTLKHAPFLVALCLLVHPLLAADGILLVETTTTGGTTKTNQIQLEKTRMRTESADAKGTTTVVVFDAAAQVMRMIDVPKKSYTETTKEEADRMGAQMTDVMAKMQEQLKNIPPAQRAQMEAMMKNMPGMGAAVAKTEYKKVGTDKVGKWTCDKYEGYQNGKKTSELCTVDPKALGLTVADFEVTQQLGEFFVKMMPQNADQGFSLGKNEPSGYSGVPVRRTYSVLGKETVSELTEVSHQTFADAIFAVPEGFQKKAFGR